MSNPFFYWCTQNISNRGLQLRTKQTNMKPDAVDMSAVTGEASEKTKTSNGVTAAGKKDQVNRRINNKSTGS